MADQSDNTELSVAPASGGKSKLKVMLLIFGLLGLEGGGIFFATKMMYNKPEATMAKEVSDEDKTIQSLKDHVEIAIPELNAYNKRDGRLFLYNVQVTIRVQSDKKEQVEEIISMRESTIKDRFNTVIRSADSKYLNEPELKTIRRQLQHELENVMGDDQLIEELLIPKFFQSPANV
ncbi:MAG TPA: hypothetical protein PKN33_07665 [Phycisphaerae bacterium]|nr:hypothetical protein [Phycisphaerales bacterium]HNO77924.1 hypothetical protein [Phycisphaerae bacterium]